MRATPRASRHCAQRGSQFWKDGFLKKGVVNLLAGSEFEIIAAEINVFAMKSDYVFSEKLHGSQANNISLAFEPNLGVCETLGRMLACGG